MKKCILNLIGASVAFLSLHDVAAQSVNQAPFWSLQGNSNAAFTSKLGTTTPVPLRLVTDNAVRVTIESEGNVGIGNTNPVALLDVNSDAPRSALRAQVDGVTKFLVNRGGVSIGSGALAPTNGLYVAGRVGIGDNAPVYPLDVLNPIHARGINVLNTNFGSLNHIGVYARSVGNPGWGYGIHAYGGRRGIWGTGQGTTYTGSTIGVYGTASGSAGNRFGVRGSATGTGSGNRYGVYGSASGGTFHPAGYFNGEVWASVYRTISDRKFKNGITPIENTLEQVMKLRPSTYTFKTAQYVQMHLPEGKQIGLIADEVKAVFPQLVDQGVQPAEYNEDNDQVISPEIKFEGVNYQGLVPVLVASVQELYKKSEAENAELKARITELEILVSKLSNGTFTVTPTGMLLQNKPNPARNVTRISYTLPDGANNARLNITDALGRTVKTLQLSTSGVVNVDASSLGSGVYNYSLIVNGRTIQTRKMTVAR